MKYFIDTEFIEGAQKSRFGRNTKPTIDLISIGIVCEDGREYYAISKDFNLREAWNRHDKKPNKKFWIRDNVLYPIYLDLSDIELHEQYYYNKNDWTYREFKRLINKYGKTNKQIAEEIKEFTHLIHSKLTLDGHRSKPEFYGYYCDYDWVVFCWLFGKMIDLPKGFPMYCIDLKQEYDREQNNFISMNIGGIKYKELKTLPNYPKQTNEHSAIHDARWNYRLYKFINSI